MNLTQCTAYTNNWTNLRRAETKRNNVKPIESPHKRKHTSSDSGGLWRQECIGVGPDYNVSFPHSRSRYQHKDERYPKEVRWTVIPSKGKDSDNSDSRKTCIILMF